MYDTFKTLEYFIEINKNVLVRFNGIIYWLETWFLTSSNNSLDSEILQPSYDWLNLIVALL